MLQELGLTISVQKNILPSQQVVCLGVLIDTQKFTMSVPSDKLQDIAKMLEAWRSEHICFKREFQSLLGFLLYISKCVRYARFFQNRLLPQDSIQIQKLFMLGKEARRDIAWFQRFIHQFNGTSFFVKSKMDKEVHLDACLTGVGAIFDEKSDHTHIPEKFKNFDIAALKMLNILVATRTWANEWQNRTIEVHCDHLSVVTVLCSGKTKILFWLLSP